MKDKEKAGEIAAQRVQLVAPLVAEGLDAAKMRQLKEQISAQTGVSDRTLRRYMAQYRENGYQGLLPKGRTHPAKEDAIPAEILNEAILLRREVPTRSVSQIIQLLEWEKLALPGQIKRSTLQEKLTHKGYSTRHMRMYQSTGVATRRFQKRYRNQLWQADIKFGPHLPIGPKGERKQVYMVAFIDDATRMTLHAEFYSTLEQMIVEDCFRQAINKYGAPEATYFDNGKQFRNKWMTRACSKLGVKLLYTRPYAAESKGKVERLNRTVGAFLAEEQVEKPQTLERLNELFWAWLDECYQHKGHTALENQISPVEAFNRDTKPLRFPEPEVVANAFLRCEERKVDKAGCISFNNLKYVAGLNFVGYKVQVVYDPADTSVLTLEYDGHLPWKALPQVIGAHVGSKPKMPEHTSLLATTGSRVLNAAEKQNEVRREQKHLATSYRKTGGNANV